MAATKAKDSSRAMLPKRCAWFSFWVEFVGRAQPSCALFSRQQTRNNTGGHGSSELLIEPLKLIRQLVVVNAKAVKDRCVEIPHRDWVLDHVVAIVIGLAVRDAG